MEQAQVGSKDVIDCIGCVSGTFSIHDEIASDGFPKLTTATTRQLMSIHFIIILKWIDFI